MADRQDWEHATGNSRHLAIAADTELRRRHPGHKIEPLRSAEPLPVTATERDGRPSEPATRIGDLAAKHHAFHERAGQRQHQMTPAKTWAGLPSATLRPPGLNDDKTVDNHLLRKWVTASRRMLKEADRTSIGDECIGEVLSGSPNGVDGIWPAEPIRQLMEDLKSDSLDRGLAIGKQNSRGVVSRGVFDGGRQEDGLANQYDTWSKQVMTRWPITGRLLREMARSYRIWARHEDMESDEWAARE
jgi:hypothetical protein